LIAGQASVPLTASIALAFGQRVYANQASPYSREDPDLELNWGVVKDWTEESRYERKTQAKAQKLIAAITDAAHWVLPWIRQHW